MEDKTAPKFDCTPKDITQIDGRDLVCTDVNDVLNQVGLSEPEVTDNCEIANTWFEDVLHRADDCGTTTITRTWYAVDAVGHEAEPCVQTIHFGKPSLEQVEKPTDEVRVSCDFVQELLDADDGLTEAELLDENGHPTPLALELLYGEGAGYPYIGEQKLDETYCNIGADYEDISVINVCANTIKIVRQWIILDWCDVGDQNELNNSTRINHRQIIKFGDFTAPTVEDLEGTIYVSTSALDCKGTFTIPAIDMEDNCAVAADLAVEAILYKKVTVDVLGNFGQVIFGVIEDGVITTSWNLPSLPDR